MVRGLDLAMMTMAPSHLPNLKSIAALMKHSAYLGSEAELRIDIAKIFCVFASDKVAAITAAPTYSTAYSWYGEKDK